VYDLWRRGRLVRRIAGGIGWLVGPLVRLMPRLPAVASASTRVGNPSLSWSHLVWRLIVLLVVAYALWRGVLFARTTPHGHEVLVASWLGLLTLTRVIVLIALASLVWVPIGVWIGLRPNVSTLVQPVAQFLAAFPANVLFPIAVVLIVAWKLDPDIWL